MSILANQQELLKSLRAKADEVKDLRTQLAKANERVKELEHENKIAKAHLCLDKIEGEITEIKAKQALNKFAIEKKIELLSEMVSSASVYLFKHDKLDIRANHLDMLLKNFCNYHREQLRKGQE